MYKKIMKIKWLIPNHVEYNSAWICMYNVFLKKIQFWEHFTPHSKL